MERTPKAAIKSKCVYSTPDNTSLCDSSAQKSRQKLSSSLRERLKRTRRSFTSPLSVAKRLCVDEEDDHRAQQVAADTKEMVNSPPVIVHNGDVNRNVLRSSSEGFTGNEQSPDLAQQRDRLRREVKDKTETLRRLKMVKMYRSKNDLTQLQTLIDKWRSCAQAALCELQSEVTKEGQKASLSELIDLFGLDDSILHFERSEGDFTT